MRHRMNLKFLGFSMLLSPLVFAQDLPLAKGTTYVTVMTSKLGGATPMTSTMTYETTVTGISDSTITYNQHITGKSSMGATTFNLPSQDMKDQTYARTPPGSAAPSGGADPKLEESDLEVSTEVFKGKVHVVHVKTGSGESWASKEPFEAIISLPGDKKLKTKCLYARSSQESPSNKAEKLNTEILTMADFPIINLFMHSADKQIDTTFILREVR